MKAKVVFSLFVLGLVSFSFADIVVGDFENSTDGWWTGGWNPGDTSMPVQANATLGEWSMQMTQVQGGWDNTIECDLGGTAAQAVLGAYGKVSVDITTFADDFPAGWAQLGLLVNTGLGEEGGWAQTLWDVFDWQNVEIGTTQTLVFQISEDAMSKMAQASGWANIGFISNTESNESDPITGEPAYPTMAVYYFDNIRVLVPEPASLILLGLGGLSLLRRR